jgi:hypothetical protein
MSKQQKRRVSNLDDASSISVRENLRKTSLNFLLSEEIGLDDPTEEEEMGVQLVDDKADNKSKEDKSEEFDELGTELEKMYAKSDAKFSKLLVSLRAQSPKMTETVKLMTIATKSLKKAIADTQNIESIALYAASETFMNSFAFLMVSIRKSTRTMTDDDGNQLDGGTTLEQAYGGKDELKDVIALKFIQSIGFRQKMVNKLKPFAEYFKNVAATGAATGEANESFFYNDDSLLKEDLFEATNSNQILAEAGFFQSLLKLFGGGKFKFKDFMKGLFRVDPKDIKGSVKNMLPLFGGKNIVNALLTDLLSLTIEEVKELLNRNVNFYKESLSSTSTSSEKSSEKKEEKLEVPKIDNVKSQTSPPPTKKEIQTVKKIDTNSREKINNDLEEEYGAKIAKAFTDVTAGKKTLKDFDGKMQKILAIIIKDLSSQIEESKTMTLKVNKEKLSPIVNLLNEQKREDLFLKRWQKLAGVL